jgi:ABC-type transport system involved in cytochrome bd biosynthesis fused ATPase/permease subunit
MIEMIYHLQLDMSAGPEVHFLGLTLNVQARWSWIGAGVVLASASALFEVARRRFMRVGRGADRDRPGISRLHLEETERATHERHRKLLAYAVELKDLRKSFGKTEIIRGANLAVAPGERVAIIGPNGAGKSTLFNLISGRFGADQRRDPAQRPAHRRPEALRDQPLGLARSFQVSNLFTRLSVFENLRCAVLWSLGYRYSFWKFLANLHDANARADA